MTLLLIKNTHLHVSAETLTAGLLVNFCWLYCKLKLSYPPNIWRVFLVSSHQKDNYLTPQPSFFVTCVQFLWYADTHTDSTRVCVCAPARVWEWQKGEGSLAKLSSASLTSPHPQLPFLSALPSPPAVWFHSYLAHSKFNPCIQITCRIWWFVCCLWGFGGVL